MSYIEAIQQGFPGVQCHSTGLEDLYENIVWDSGVALPSKATLDEWIAANPTAGSSDKRVTVLAFRNRFTVNEKIATEMASIVDPAAAPAARQFAAAIRVILRDTESANYIDLNRAETRQGVNMMEQYGIIAAGRAAVILDSPVLETERPLV